MRSPRDSRRKSFHQVNIYQLSVAISSSCFASEHVLEALATLGFPEYIEDVKAVHREYKEQASVSHTSSLSPSFGNIAV